MINECRALKRLCPTITPCAMVCKRKMTRVIHSNAPMAYSCLGYGMFSVKTRAFELMRAKSVNVCVAQILCSESGRRQNHVTLVCGTLPFRIGLEWSVPGVPQRIVFRLN